MITIDKNSCLVLVLDRRINAKEILVSLFNESKKYLVFDVGDDFIEESFKLSLEVKKILPDIKVVILSKTLDAYNAFQKIESHVFDIHVVATKDEFLSLELDSFRVIYRNQDDKVDAILPHKNYDLTYDVGIVLMPAWNNDFPPFGLAHLSSSLRGQGIGTLVIDANVEFWREIKRRNLSRVEFENLVLWIEKEKYIAKGKLIVEQMANQVLDQIERKGLKYIGFSLFQSNLFATEDILIQIRQRFPHLKTFIGGPSCTKGLANQWFQRQLIDGAVFGEGEYTIIDLVKFFQSGNPKVVAGAWVKSGDDLIKGPDRTLAELDQLPLPNFDDFPVYHYHSFALPIFFGRGCVAKCTFCYETQYWKKFRVLSPAKIVDSMELAVQKYGLNLFQVNDSLMNGDVELLEAVADEILRRGLKVYYRGYCRLDKKLNQRIFDKLSRSGCKTISYGLESASQKVINLMRKGVQVTDYDRLIRETHQSGIACAVCVMVGFPGESWFDYFKTVWCLLKNSATSTK